MRDMSNGVNIVIILLLGKPWAIVLLKTRPCDDWIDRFPDNFCQLLNGTLVLTDTSGTRLYYYEDFSDTLSEALVESII